MASARWVRVGGTARRTARHGGMARRHWHLGPSVCVYAWMYVYVYVYVWMYVCMCVCVCVCSVYVGCGSTGGCRSVMAARGGGGRCTI